MIKNNVIFSIIRNINKIKRLQYKVKSSSIKIKIIIILFLLFIILIYKYEIVNIINIQKRKTNYSHLRIKMFKTLSYYARRKVNYLEDVFVGSIYSLGNSLLAINKAIFYCEILNCKRILLNKCQSKFIKHIIYDKEYNLTIEPASTAKRNKSVSLFKWPCPYYIFLKVMPENRFDVIKEEILKNLPKISPDKNDLYIHIRNGNVFKHPKTGRNYGQPPLCFYKKVIESKMFNNIYIIAENDDYPIIKILIKDYKNVFYKKNSLRTDVSKLVYAYNIVASISSFCTSLIKLNDNLKYVWEYDMYHRVTKINLSSLFYF